MSKMDNLRAMREAKYAEALKRSAAAARGTAPKAASTTPTGTTGALPKAARSAAPKTAEAAAADTTAAAEPTRCGHRNMSGRSCTREHGHAAKSHRYS